MVTLAPLGKILTRGLVQLEKMPRRNWPEVLAIHEEHGRGGPWEICFVIGVHRGVT